MEMKDNKKRIYWLDVARVIAIISITLNHAVNRSYDNYHDQMAEYLAIPFASTIFKTVITVFSRMGVPLFLMISGTLLLNKSITDEDGIRRFYLHNCLDLLITSEIWYFIMYVRLTAVSLLRSDDPLSLIPGMIIGLIKTMLFIDQVTFDSMWYIPMILSVYLLIPLFALLLKKVSLKAFIAPCIIVFISSMLVPGINAFMDLSGSDMQISFALTSSNVFSKYLLYVFAGYWISQGGLDRLKKSTIWILSSVFFAIACIAQLYAYSRPQNYLVSSDYNSPLCLFSVVFLYDGIRRIKDKQGIIADRVAYLSKISFGVYFVHIILMTLINKLPIYSWPRPIILLFLEVASVGGSVIIIWLLSHIDIFKRRLFLIKD